MISKWTLSVMCVVAIAVPAAASAQAAKPDGAVKTVSITVADPVGEKMEFSVKQIIAKPGEKIRLRLVSIGTMPKMVMAHNWVLLKGGTNVKAFVDAAAAARATDFIPAKMKGSILAMTDMVGPGERLEVTFTAPTAPGTYDYICSFAGHYAAGMFGKLVVK